MKIIEIAGDTDDHVIAHDKRRHRRPVTFRNIGYFDIPTNRSRLRIERNEVPIWRQEVD